jgi:hypothetical protein
MAGSMSYSSLNGRQGIQKPDTWLSRKCTAGDLFLNRPAVAAEEFEPFPVTGAESIFGFWCPTHESTP